MSSLTYCGSLTHWIRYEELIVKGRSYRGLIDHLHNPPPILRLRCDQTHLILLEMELWQTINSVISLPLATIDGIIWWTNRIENSLL